MIFRCKNCLKTNRMTMVEYRKKQSPNFCNRDCFDVWVKRVRVRLIAEMTHEEWKNKMDNAVLKQRPITTLRDMSPEKQREIKNLYEARENACKESSRNTALVVSDPRKRNSEGHSQISFVQ